MKPDWISAHIFYNNDLHPLLVDCVRPLIGLLRERGLLSRYFFVRYWEGGSHVRLRMLPTDVTAVPEIKAILEDSIGSFLTVRPALFDHLSKMMGPSHAKMFELEYGRAALLEKYGPSGEIPYYPNNSIHYIGYEPEVVRYGGPAGMEIAEKHFEISSDTVLTYLHETNTHVRSVLLGQSFQIMLDMVLTLLRHEERIAGFLDSYLTFWNSNYFKQTLELLPKAARAYDRSVKSLQDRVYESFARERCATQSSLAVESRWLQHAVGLREDLEDAISRGLLIFPPHADRMRSGIEFLLTSYIHMTNNRLGISIPDEVYLAYLIRRSMDGIGSEINEHLSIAALN